MLGLLPATWEGTWAAGGQPCLLPMAEAGGALPGWQLLVPSFHGTMGLAVPGRCADVWTQGALGCKRCWWFTAAQQGLVPEGSSAPGKLAARLAALWWLCAFFHGFPKNSAFCNLPSPSTKLFLAEPLQNLWELSF